MTDLDLTEMNAGLKELYTDQRVHSLVYTDHPLLAMIRKVTNFGGKYKPIPIIHGVSQGRSATFAKAQTNQTAAEVDSFLLTRKKDYSIATIQNELMEASAVDKMSFIQGAKLLVDSALQVIVMSLAAALYRSGTGTIGRISSISTGVITLSVADDVARFERNMTLQANETDGGSPRAALGYVIAVNRSAGTVTVASSGLDGSAATPSGWTANDYLLVEGDNNAKMSGLDAWIPATAPGATLFYNVNRSLDVTRLGGLRYDGSAQPIEEALIDAASIQCREGGNPTHGFLTYTSYAALEKSLGSKVTYVTTEAAGISFTGISLAHNKGRMQIYADRDALPEVCFMLQMSNWSLESLNAAPHMLKYGISGDLMRVTDDDAAEVRIASYHNAACDAPGWSMRCALSQ